MNERRVICPKCLSKLLSIICLSVFLVSVLLLTKENILHDDQRGLLLVVPCPLVWLISIICALLCLTTPQRRFLFLTLRSLFCDILCILSWLCFLLYRWPSLWLTLIWAWAICCWFWWMLLAVNVQNKSHCFIFTILSLFDWWQLRNSLTFVGGKKEKNVKNTQSLPCLFLIYAQIVLHQAESGTPLIKWGLLFNFSTFALKVVWF